MKNEIWPSGGSIQFQVQEPTFRLFRLGSVFVLVRLVWFVWFGLVFVPEEGGRVSARPMIRAKPSRRTTAFASPSHHSRPLLAPRRSLTTPRPTPPGRALSPPPCRVHSPPTTATERRSAPPPHAHCEEASQRDAARQI